MPFGLPPTGGENDDPGLLYFRMCEGSEPRVHICIARQPRAIPVWPATTAAERDPLNSRIPEVHQHFLLDDEAIPHSESVGQHLYLCHTGGMVLPVFDMHALGLCEEECLFCAA